MKSMSESAIFKRSHVNYTETLQVDGSLCIRNVHRRTNLGLYYLVSFTDICGSTVMLYCYGFVAHVR